VFDIGGTLAVVLHLPKLFHLRLRPRVVHSSPFPVSEILFYTTRKGKSACNSTYRAAADAAGEDSTTASVVLFGHYTMLKFELIQEIEELSAFFTSFGFSHIFRENKVYFCPLNFSLDSYFAPKLLLGSINPPKQQI
jgi:hypothetical protein